MVKDCINYVKRCQSCLLYANLIYLTPEPLHPTIASWPFDAWGLNVVRPLSRSFVGASLHINRNKLLLKVGRSYNIKRDQERDRCKLYSDKHHLLL